jgi:hypothetical protein
MYLLVIIALFIETAGLELLDLLGDAHSTLFGSKLGDLILEGLDLPVFGLFGRLELRALADGNMSIGVNLLDVF